MADDLLYAEREPLAMLKRQRKIMGEYNFAGQYLHSLVPAGGAMIKVTWLQYKPSDEFPASYEMDIKS